MQTRSLSHHVQCRSQLHELVAANLDVWQTVQTLSLSHYVQCRSLLHELVAANKDIVKIWNLEQPCRQSLQDNVISLISQVRHFDTVCEGHELCCLPIGTSPAFAESCSVQQSYASGPTFCIHRCCTMLCQALLQLHLSPACSPHPIPPLLFTPSCAEVLDHHSVTAIIV